MNKTNRIITFLFFFFFCHINYAQKEEEIPTDDLGEVSDTFQENFFEALKQKGIENYELALQALNRAEKAAKENKEQLAVVKYEKAKNLIALKSYVEAEQNLLSIASPFKDKTEILEALYTLYYEQKDFDKAIPVVKYLIKIDEDYKEDLANLYQQTKAYEEALALLDELDEDWGESAYREALRTKIYQQINNSKGVIKTIENKITSQPQNEKEYLNLIYLYSQEGDLDKAFETAKALIKINPKATKAHLALYKYHIINNNLQLALASLREVCLSNEIEINEKQKILADFIQFVENNIQYEGEIIKLLPDFKNKNTAYFYELAGNYFIQKNNNNQALTIYQQGYNFNPDNFTIIKNNLLLQIEGQNYNEALKIAAQGLTLFPAQALLYLLKGVSLNALQQYDEAINNLEIGLDFVLDDPKMERDFYIQKALGFKGKGDIKKAREFEEKAQKINLTN